MFQKLIQWNRSICMKYAKRFPIDRFDINQRYYEHVKQTMDHPLLIYDIGGGKNCKYIESAHEHGCKVYALDISAEELTSNSKVDGKVVADVTKEIPLPYGPVDLITSHSVLEHLTSQKSFINHAYEALKPGGMFIHTFPGRYAQFAVINRFLPKKLSAFLLFRLKPDSKKASGFPAFYRDTYYKKLNHLLLSQGFKICCWDFYYYQSAYFSFCIPLFFLSRLFDRLCSLFHCRNTAAYYCVVAEKPSDNSK